MGAGDKPAPNVCCRTPMESAPPVFFSKREGDAECKTVISLDFDGLRAEQDGFTACLLTFELKKELQYFSRNNKNYYFCIDIGKSV